MVPKKKNKRVRRAFEKDVSSPSKLRKVWRKEHERQVWSKEETLGRIKEEIQHDKKANLRLNPAHQPMVRYTQLGKYADLAIRGGLSKQEFLDAMVKYPWSPRGKIKTPGILEDAVRRSLFYPTPSIMLIEHAVEAYDKAKKEKK